MTAFGKALPRIGSPERQASRALGERLRGVESPNVTYVEDHPPFWTRALGANVEDADGNVYLDFTGAFGVAFAGHRHPVVVEAVSGQIGRLIHGMGDIHPPAPKVELLEALASMAPWPEAKGILGCSGSDAVEAALKTAHMASGRAGILAFDGAYHGLALGALAATDRDHFRRPFTDRLTPHVTFAPLPTTEEELDGALDAAAAALEGGRIGAVIVEPVQGRGGVRIPTPGFLAGLRHLARSHGALLVFDEIFTGLGRTGRRFAGEWDGVTPDLLCLGKALGGGFPISTCLAPAEVMDRWPASAGEAIHTSTFLGHPLGCVAALAFLGVLEEEELAERAAELGEKALSALARGLPPERGATVRGRGLMVGLELPTPGAGTRVSSAALEQGLIVLPAGPDGRVVELTPPATLTDEQLERGLQILLEAVASAG